MKIKFIKASFIYMIISIIFWQIYETYERNHFINNLCWVFIVLLFVYNTGVGQDMVNFAHDSLVVKDFRQEILENDNTDVISNDIRIITFDQETYENNRSPGGIFWTPRELLGKTIIKTIEMGATVVAIDFSLEKPVPVTCLNGECVDENTLYLNLLQKAADMARKKGCVMIMPNLSLKEKTTKYSTAYKQLLENNKDVIICANPLVHQNSQDKIVRHFNLFQANNHDPVFSIPVLSTIYHWFGKEKGDKIIQKKITEIKERKELSRIISPQNSEKQILLFYQDPQKECMAARYRFRILPEEIIKQKFGVRYISDFIIPPFIVLDQYFDKRRIKGKIVIVGADYPDFGDIHKTAVGKIAGIYLMANAMDILLMGEQIREIHFGIKFIMMILWVLIASFLFMHISKKWSIVFLFLLIVTIYSPISVWIFSKCSVFIDFWLPLFIIGILENVETIKEYRGSMARGFRKYFNH